MLKVLCRLLGGHRWYDAGIWHHYGPLTHLRKCSRCGRVEAAK